MSTQTNTCAVTIAGPDRRVDVVVSTETPIRLLIPTFVELSVDAPPPVDGPQPVWGIAPPGKQPLAPESTLAESGIVDGAVLSLVQVRSVAHAPPAPREVHRAEIEPGRGTPRERTARALPERLRWDDRTWLATKAFFGNEPDEPLLESAEPLAPSARRVLTKPEARSPRERARHWWRETDYVGRLDRTIALPKLNRCATIAVVSPKGGVGKTTLTALLGSLLSRTRRDRIVAVDTNPDYGSLGRQLTPDHDVYVDDLVDVLDRPDLSVTALDQHLGRAFEGLMVLPAPTDPARMARVDELAYRRVIERLQSLVGVLVLDCGTGLQEPAARAAQATADQIILVSDAQPATASLVADAAHLLSTAGPPLTLVVNKMPVKEKEARIDLEGLEELVPDAHGLVTIEDDQRAAQRIAAGEFEWRDAPATWQRSVRELAVVLESDWPALGLAH
jgi:MinD-like ATPase involved in chromosome partitioning or flagellar assembly